MKRIFLQLLGSDLFTVLGLKETLEAGEVFETSFESELLIPFQIHIPSQGTILRIVKKKGTYIQSPFTTIFKLYN